jgi:hypothetical protein
MNKRLILTIVYSTIGIVLIAYLLSIGNNVGVPNPLNSGAIGSSTSLEFSKNASDPNFTVLCIKKSDGKVRFTKTGSYVTCPLDYSTVPLKIDSNRIKK